MSDGGTAIATESRPAAPVIATSRPTATLGRTWESPAIALRFDRSARHRRTGKPLAEWVKKLPGRTWDGARNRWVVTGLGKKPTQALLDAGFELDLRSKVVDPDLSMIECLEDVLYPCAVRMGAGTEAVVYPRLIGYDEAVKLVPKTAAWDKTLGGWRTTCMDLVRNGEPLPGIYVDDDVIEVAARESRRVTTKSHLRKQAAHVAQSLGTNTDPKALADLIAEVGDIPEWFGGGKLNPFPYQRAGAIGVAAGHSLLADAPGVGKTLQGLAACAVVGAKRIVVLSPAKVISSWLWHATVTGITDGGGAYEGSAMSIVPGRKEKPLPDAGVVVLTDALLAGRPDTLQRLIEWAPQAIIYDESHRSKTFASKRAAAARELFSCVPDALRICSTGTPMNASPEELCSQLECTGHLGPVFGGRDAFLDAFCRQNHFKAWVAKKDALPRLRQMLDEHVWVRRNKKDVLKDLPPKSRFPMFVDVPLTHFKQAHSDVLDKIDEWLDTLDGELNSEWPEHNEYVEKWAHGQIGLMSPLRVAAGLAKVPAAAEYIADWVQAELKRDDYGNPVVDRPLCVWVHHKEVASALVEAALDAVSDKSLVRSIVGGTTDKAADAAVADFQAGRVAVLVLSITAAGVGITLTKGSDVLFVETTYVNAEVSQAEDRCHRVGTKSAVTIQTMIAPGTLDERIQAVLGSKADVLDEVLVGGDNRTAVIDAKTSDLASPGQIVASLVWEAVARRAKGKRRIKYAEHLPDLDQQRNIASARSKQQARGDRSWAA